MRADPGQPGGAHGGEDQTGRDDHLGADRLRATLLTTLDPMTTPAMKGRKASPACSGRESQDALEVVGEQQEHADDADSADECAEVGGAAEPVGDHAERYQRVRDPVLDQGERGEQRDPAGERADRLTALPQPLADASLNP